MVLFPHFVLNIEELLILFFLIMETFYSTVSCHGLSIIVLISILLDMGIILINRYVLYRNLCANNTQLEYTFNEKFSIELVQFCKEQTEPKLEY